MAIIALKMSALPKASGTRPRVVVVTQGADPTVVANMGKVAIYDVEKLENELMVDINGAGDAFVGGFVSKLILGKAVELASRLALALPVPVACGSRCECAKRPRFLRRPWQVRSSATASAPATGPRAP